MMGWLLCHPTKGPRIRESANPDRGTAQSRREQSSVFLAVDSRIPGFTEPLWGLRREAS